MIIALANKSITTNGFTSWSVLVMISSVNDYTKPLLNCVGSLSLSNIITRAIEMTGFTIHQKSEFSVVSHSQTAIFSFILGREKIGSGTPPIEKAVLASTAIGVGDYWQWLLCNR